MRSRRLTLSQTGTDKKLKGCVRHLAIMGSLAVSFPSPLPPGASGGPLMLLPISFRSLPHLYHCDGFFFFCILFSLFHFSLSELALVSRNFQVLSSSSSPSSSSSSLGDIDNRKLAGSNGVLVVIAIISLITERPGRSGVRAYYQMSRLGRGIEDTRRIPQSKSQPLQ